MRSRPRQRPDLAGAAKKQLERTRASPLSELPSQGLRRDSELIPASRRHAHVMPPGQGRGRKHAWQDQAPGKVSRSESCGKLGRGDAPVPGANPEEPPLAAP